MSFVQNKTFMQSVCPKVAIGGVTAHDGTIEFHSRIKTLLRPDMTVLDFGGQLLIVDCGVLFPEDHQPGVDLILPDFDYLRDRLADVVGLVLTHGHEDHIGGVPYLLR